MRQFWEIVVVAFCVGAMSACSPQTASGAYVYSSPNEVAMLQLVEGHDGSLSGSLQTATANARHEVRVDSVALSGTVDGNNLTLSTPTFLGIGMTFSGARSGNEITLTFTTSGNVNTIAFQRSTTEEFSSLTERLRQVQGEQAAEVAQRREARQALANDQAIRDAIPGLSAELEKTAGNDVAATQQINAAAAQFADYAEQARETARARDREADGVRQSQLSVQINQISVATIQLNIQVEQAQREFEQHRNTLRQQMQRASDWCARTHDAVCNRFEPRQLATSRSQTH